MLVDDDDLARTLNRCGEGGHEADRSAAEDHDGVAGLNAGEASGVPASWKYVGEHYVVVLLFFRVFGEFQAVEIGVRNAQVFGLAAVVRAHASETIGCACCSGIGSETEACKATLAVFAEPTGNVEWKADIVADLDGVDGVADLNHSSQVFVS